MKDRKRRMENFLFYDSDRIVVHLEHMALKGWQLEKITPYYWQYRKCEPKKLRYCVTYFSEASDFNPGPTENQQSFLDYCEEAGWKLVTSWAQMQVFYSEEESPVAIETDERMKLANVKRCMWKNFLPGTLVFGVWGISLIGLELWNMWKRPITNLSSVNTISQLLMGVILLSMATGHLINYFSWYHRSRKSVENGGVCIQSGRWYQKVFTPILVVLVTVVLLYQIINSSFFPNKLWIWGCIALFIAFASWATLTFRNRMKENGISWGSNIVYTLIFDMVLCAVLIGILIVAIPRVMKGGGGDRNPTTTYSESVNDETNKYILYHDDLPLIIEDIQPIDNSERYSYEWRQEETPLLQRSSGRQFFFGIIGEVEPPDLFYQILDTHIPWAYEMCLQQHLRRYDDSYDEKTGIMWEKYVRQEDLEYNGETVQVYQKYSYNKPESDYLLCLETRIIRLCPSWLLTPDQFAIAVEKLISNE